MKKIVKNTLLLALYLIFAQKVLASDPWCTTPSKDVLNKVDHYFEALDLKINDCIKAMKPEDRLKFATQLKKEGKEYNGSASRNIDLAEFYFRAAIAASAAIPPSSKMGSEYAPACFNLANLYSEENYPLLAKKYYTKAFISEQGTPEEIAKYKAMDQEYANRILLKPCKNPASIPSDLSAFSDLLQNPETFLANSLLFEEQLRVFDLNLKNAAEDIVCGLNKKPVDLKFTPPKDCFQSSNGTKCGDVAMMLSIKFFSRKNDYDEERKKTEPHSYKLVFSPTNISNTARACGFSEYTKACENSPLLESSSLSFDLKPGATYTEVCAALKTSLTKLRSVTPLLNLDP